MIHSSISGHLRFSIAWLLPIVLPRTREYRCLFKLKSFFFSDKYPEVEWLDLIWTVLRRTGQVFCRPPLYWVSSDSFLMIRLPSWVWGRKTTKVNCRSRHMRSRVYSISVTYYGWGWPWPPGWGSVGQFSPLKNFSFSSFPCHPLWKAITGCSLHERSGVPFRFPTPCLQFPIFSESPAQRSSRLSLEATRSGTELQTCLPSPLRPSHVWTRKEQPYICEKLPINRDDNPRIARKVPVSEVPYSIP